MLSHVFTSIVIIGALAVSEVKAIPKISVTGSKFFTEDGDQFFVKGMNLTSFRSSSSG